MLIVTGTFELSTDDIPRFKEAARLMSEATRTETGCITYAFWQSIEDETQFRVYEEWRDLPALEAHFVAPHMSAFRESLAKCQPIKRDVVRFMAQDVTAL